MKSKIVQVTVGVVLGVAFGWFLVFPERKEGCR